MAETENKGKANNRMVLIVAVLVILAIINGIQYYMAVKSEKRNREIIESKELQLVATYAKYDSISGQLDMKINEIQKLGGDIDSLLIIKEQLEREKNELKLSRNLAQERYNKIRDKIAGYESLLKRKDEEISKLREVNKALLSENIDLKTQKNELNQEISSLQQERGELQEKISVAATLNTENLKFFAINRRGKERDGDEFKTKQLDKLKITFNLEENALAEVGAKNIIMRIIEPEGSALYNVAAGSGTFEHNGEEIFYTSSKEILFDNSNQLVTFEYEKGSEFKKGLHKVEFYAEGAVIGQGQFIVN